MKVEWRFPIPFRTPNFALYSHRYSLVVVVVAVVVRISISLRRCLSVAVGYYSARFVCPPLYDVAVERTLLPCGRIELWPTENASNDPMRRA